MQLILSVKKIKGAAHQRYVDGDGAAWCEWAFTQSPAHNEFGYNEQISSRHAVTLDHWPLATYFDLFST